MTRADFLPGNTRLRARIPGLLHPSVDWDAESAVSLLRAVPDAYGQPARELVEVLTGRYDLADILALVRGTIGGQPPEQRLRALHTAGRLTPPLAASLVHSPDGAALVARLTDAGLPAPEAVVGVRQAWVRHELHDDPDELEAEITDITYAAWRHRIHQAGAAARSLAWLLDWERDQRNLSAVLRLPPDSRPDAVRLLAPARLGRRELRAAHAGDLRPAMDRRPEWRPAFATPTSATQVDTDLRRLLGLAGRRLLHRGDPFTAAPAVGFVLVLETTSATQRERHVRQPQEALR